MIKMKRVGTGQLYNCPDSKNLPNTNETDKFDINLVQTVVVAIGYYPRKGHERISHFLRTVALGF